jgi:hypothetical protein
METIAKFRGLYSETVEWPENSWRISRTLTEARFLAFFNTLVSWWGRSALKFLLHSVAKWTRVCRVATSKHCDSLSLSLSLSLSHRTPPQAADVRPQRPNHSRFKTPDIHRTKILHPMKGQRTFAIWNGGNSQYDHKLQNNLHAHARRVSQLCKKSVTFKWQ